MHRIHPVPGLFVVGTPAVVTEVKTRKEADELVGTGAFTHAAPGRRAPAAPKRAKRSRARAAAATPATSAPSEPATPAATEPEEA